MNTITMNSMVQTAMDGQSLYNNNIKISAKTETIQPDVQPITATGAQVAQNIEASMSEIKADTQELQKMSEMVAGNKLLFNVNKELGAVVVTVVDSATNKVVKQIPSEDMLNLKLRIRKAIGNVFDEII